MRPDIINRYNNNYVNNDNHVQKKDNDISAKKIEKKQSPDKSGDVNNINRNVKNYNNVITKQERQFFVKMFPESKEQIENHVLFNRNGKVKNTNLYKGSLVDGKV